MKQNDFYEVNGCTEFIPVTINETFANGVSVKVHTTTYPFNMAVKQVYQFLKPHEPQKVVVPKFVAEWIEKCKDMNCSLRDAMKNTKLSAGLNAWFLKTGQDMFTYPNQEIFARAWLDGYTVEQEQLYTVEIPDPHSYYNYRYLKRNGRGVSFSVSDSLEWKERPDSQLTEAEIKQDFEWAWNAGFAKEVE